MVQALHSVICQVAVYLVHRLDVNLRPGRLHVQPVECQKPVSPLERWIGEHIIEETQQRVEAHPEIMQQRKELVEHPFGTIKHWWDQGHFLMKGLEKVRAEFSLSTLAYNIRRVLNILGVQRLIAALRERKWPTFVAFLLSPCSPERA